MANEAIHSASLASQLTPDTTAAALNLIGHAPGCSIDDIAGLLSLSHPGTVRLVDRLVQEGLVTKSTGVDRRCVSLGLTEAGLNRRDLLQTGRLGRLADMVKGLSSKEKRTLEALLENYCSPMLQPWSRPGPRAAFAKNGSAFPVLWRSSDSGNPLSV